MKKAELYFIPQTSIDTVAIIGGGVASICLMAELLKVRPELKITLLCEDKKLGMAASGNKQGAIYPHLQGSLSPLAQVNALCYQYARDFYESLAKAGIEFEHSWCGVLQQAHTQELAERFQKVARVWPELVAYVDAETSSELSGLKVPYPSLWYEQGGWLAPFQLCQNAARYFSEEHQVDIRCDSQITDVHRRADKWQLASENSVGSENFDAVFICAGFKSVNLELAQNLPIEPTRGQVSRFHPNTVMASLKTVLCHKGYITPAQPQYQCFGATFDKGNVQPTVTEFDESVNFNQLQSIYKATEWSHQLNQADIIGNKAGIRGNSPDHIPIVGPLYSDDWVRNNVDQNNGQLKRKDKLKYVNAKGQADYQDNELCGLYVLTGLGARGLTTAPLLAKHLAEQVFSQPNTMPESLISAISPMRFQVRNLKRNKRNS